MCHVNKKEEKTILSIILAQINMLTCSLNIYIFKGDLIENEVVVLQSVVYLFIVKCNHHLLKHCLIMASL